MSPPSRRTVLRTCSLAVAGGLAGCLGTVDDPDQSQDTPDGQPTSQPTHTPSDGPDARLGARGEADEAVTVTVELRSDGQVLQDERVRLTRGRGTSINHDVPAGEYVVVARASPGASASYEWSVDADYEGSLTVVAAEGGELTFREHLAGPPCETHALPYAAPEAPETFSPGALDLRNETGGPATVSFSLAHGGETVYDCTFDLAAHQAVDVDRLTRTAGTYTVTVDVDGGGRTVHDWRVPENYHWPRLSVVLPADGGPIVGCGFGGEVDVAVENPTDGAQTVTLALRRDGEAVAEETVDVAANGTADVGLATPAGDFYALEATTAAGAAQAEVVNCYCYGAYRTTVTLESAGPDVESELQICE